jgi:hypothetical protein
MADKPDDSEVGEEDRAVRTAQNVAGFDVPVHHPQGMDVGQRVGDRPADPRGLGRRKSRGARVRSANVTPSISCMTTKEMPASVPASKTATILGCCSRANA